MDRKHREKRSRKSDGMVHAERGVTFRDFLIFQLKLVLDGIKDVVLFNVSIGAMGLDFVAGRGKRPRLFYSVLRASERFDLWLNLNGAMERIDAGDDEEGDGLFGASAAGSDTLLGQLEQLVRGGDEPLKPKKFWKLADDVRSPSEAARGVDGGVGGGTDDAPRGASGRRGEYDDPGTGEDPER